MPLSEILNCIAAVVGPIPSSTVSSIDKDEIKASPKSGEKAYRIEMLNAAVQEIDSLPLVKFDQETADAILACIISHRDKYEKLEFTDDEGQKPVEKLYQALHKKVKHLNKFSDNPSGKPSPLGDEIERFEKVRPVEDHKSNISRQLNDKLALELGPMLRDPELNANSIKEKISEMTHFNTVYFQEPLTTHFGYNRKLQALAYEALLGHSKLEHFYHHHQAGILRRLKKFSCGSFSGTSTPRKLFRAIGRHHHLEIVPLHCHTLNGKSVKRLADKLKEHATVSGHCQPTYSRFTTGLVANDFDELSISANHSILARITNNAA